MSPLTCHLGFVMANLLIAEDDPSISNLIARYLTRLGHTYHIARDGLTALGLLDDETFDVVITDLNLPALPGRALLERLHSAPSRPGVIICSGLSDQQEVAALADAVLPKPFLLNDLASLVNQLAAVPQHQAV